MLSLTGHKLRGERMTKLVYLDETGTNKKDPFLVVAGVVVDPDKDLSALEQGLKNIILELIPEPLFLSESMTKGFSFHAVDYMNGGKAYESYKKEGGWTFEQGYAVAEAIVDVVEKTNSAVALGVARKSELDDIGKAEYHSIALARAACGIERYMLGKFPGENCILIAENHDQHREALKDMVRIITNPLYSIRSGLGTGAFPLLTIRDTVHFVTKTESFGCQVADTVCYIIKKSIDGDERYSALSERIMARVIYPQPA